MSSKMEDIKMEDIKIMTYNVLAYSATKHNKILNKNNETILEREARYEIIIATLNDSDCDVILLQEVDPTLFDKMKKELLNYSAISSDVINNGGIDNGRFETCVLFKNDKFETINSISFISSDDRTTYDGKNALAINLKLNDHDLTFVSLHLSGKDETAAKQLLTDIEKNVKDRKNVIVAGDFNCDFDGCDDAHECNLCKTKLTQDEVKRILNNNTVNGGFNEAICMEKCTSKTTCSFDYANESVNDTAAVIDRIFYKGFNFNQTTYQILTPGCIGNNAKIWNRSEGADTKKIVINASDHFPVMGVFSLPQKKRGGVKKNIFSNPKRNKTKRNKTKRNKTKRNKRRKIMLM
ncbi:endonuclease/exonuclease/phosphatase family protein [bacterium]|nr:endonuclease/exonuclease/phosphatase family protein [bacterium]